MLTVLLLNIVQICHEFERFSKYLLELRVAVFYGGVHIKNHKDLLKNECPHIVVGTPGRILALARDKDLPLKNVRHFILDECDKMLESLGRVLSLANSYICIVHFNLMVSSPILHFSVIVFSSLNNLCMYSPDMRRDVQEIFKMTPHDKQVMMFSATLSKEIRPVCKRFMQDVMSYGLTHFNCPSSYLSPLASGGYAQYDRWIGGSSIVSSWKGLLVALLTTYQFL